MQIFVTIAGNEHNLLSAIVVPFTQPGMYFDQGDDGFPAFGILPTSDIKEHYRVQLPLILYREFSIVCTVSVKSKAGGFVFAVMNPTETVNYSSRRRKVGYLGPVNDSLSFLLIGRPVRSAIATGRSDEAEYQFVLYGRS